MVLIKKVKSWGETYAIYIIGFVFALHTAIPAYINSTFLSQFISENVTGLVYSFSSILTILSLVTVPRFLKKFGNYKIILYLLVADAITILLMATSHNAFVAVGSFIINFITLTIISLSLDIFLEKVCTAKNTGKIRGFFLTSVNIAWVLSQFSNSLLMTDFDYYKAYLASALLIIPIFALIIIYFRKFNDNLYQKSALLKTLLKIWKEKNILDIFMINFLLQFFYAWMVIYTPIYLYEYMNFSWSEIGIIFGIMLLPFALFELPLGKIADNKLGEKEILTVGFIVAALSTVAIAFISTKSFVLWAGILFLTRTGAAAIEIMSETYFFKKVSNTDANTVSLFRTMRPFAYSVSPIIGSVFLSFFEIKFLFIFLGLILLYGVRFSLTLKDTR